MQTLMRKSVCALLSLLLLLLLPVPQLVVLLLKRRLLSTLFSRAQVLLSSKLLRPLRNTAVSA